jgi:uncharacterized cupin superfamily protein
VSESPGIVRAEDVPAEERPRFVKGPGVASHVRPIGNAAGLTQMGVSIRIVEPGRLGSNRHFHTIEEEWAFVLSGTGVARIGPHRLDVGPGTFLGYPPGPRPHDLLATGAEPLVFLEGGERRRDEERGWYVDMGLVFGHGKISKADGPPPPEEGDPSQCLHVDSVESVYFDHPVDAGAHREMRGLSEGTGLRSQVVRWGRVEVGQRSTAYHTHTRTDEWIYLLSGEAELRLADRRLPVGAGDFIAHPANSPAHVMEPTSPLTYLMGGQRDHEDVVLYPEHGVQLTADGLEPIP